MKKFCLTITIVGFLLFCVNGVKAQTTQTESPKAGAEYKILDAWSGIWNIQGEVRDSISAPYYHVDWTIKGERILNGYAIEIFHQMKIKDFTLNGIEVTGYDPIKKACMTHVFYDDGSWGNSIPKFIDKRTCIEDGTFYYPNGNFQIWRTTWNFSDDWMSVTVKYEILKDNIWSIRYELKGIRTAKSL